jgi:hypothetical protein
VAPEDLEEMLAWANRSARGTWARNEAKSSVAATPTPGELLVRVTPTRVVAKTDIAD